MKSKLVVAVALTLGTLSSAALAEKSSKTHPAKGSVLLDETIISLKTPRPVAAIDIVRLQPKLTLTELRQPLIERIEAAIESEPF